MDVLGDILSTLELRSTVYFRAVLSAPFAIQVPEDRDVIRFHVANHGPCTITLPTGEKVRFAEGDLVLVPHGAAHVLADSLDSPPMPLPVVLEESGFNGTGPLEFGGGGNKTSLVCGYFSFAHTKQHPIIASLPTLIHIKGNVAGRFDWFERLIAHMEWESKANAVAWTEIVKRISEILFIYVLREYLTRTPIAQGALLALGDPKVGPALRAIHENPAETWSVETLAKSASMSRSAFADSFRELLGMTPGQYVIAWRMHKARSLLDHTTRSIQEIAWEVGYESATAFNRVFKGYFDQPPGRYRRSLPNE